MLDPKEQSVRVKTLFYYWSKSWSTSTSWTVWSTVDTVDVRLTFSSRPTDTPFITRVFLLLKANIIFIKLCVCVILFRKLYLITKCRAFDDMEEWIAMNAMHRRVLTRTLPFGGSAIWFCDCPSLIYKESCIVFNN